MMAGKKIMLFYGTRPELIKLAPLIFILKKNKKVNLKVVNTGQHKEMVDDLEAFFSIKPDFKLNIMKDNQSLNEISEKITKKANSLLLVEKPDIVVIQGDTSSVLGIGLVAFNLRIKVAHVEAGLRSFDMEHPFPEEFNRRAVSLFASYNFAPTKQSVQQLINERIPKSKIFLTGNTIVDAIQLTMANQKKGKRLSKVNTPLQILITAHRRENHGLGIENICKSILLVLKKHPEVSFIWPVHPNPNVIGPVNKILGNKERVHIIPPVSYLELLKLIDESFLVWTDSGGIQEEVPTFKKPVLILRKVTERPEVISAGFGLLVGTNPNKIVAETSILLINPAEYNKRISGKNPFGDGKASDKIADILTRP